MRERRSKFANNMPLVRDILFDGTSKARAVAEDTMREVREAMKINYFNQ
jgi:tryptophanyl-tRNA synthetase